MGYSRTKYELYDCDRCKFRYKLHELRRQKGLYLCPHCYDNAGKSTNINMKLANSPRANADTVTAVTTPTVYTITAAGGITPQHSYDSGTTNSGTLGVSVSIYFPSNYYMKVVGSGAINITADPQIVAGQHGDALTIQGASDTNTVQIDDGDGVELRGGVVFVLKNNSVITLVYDSEKSKWVETSRNENGGF